MAQRFLDAFFRLECEYQLQIRSPLFIFNNENENKNFLNTWEVTKGVTKDSWIQEQRGDVYIFSMIARFRGDDRLDPEQKRIEFENKLKLSDELKKFKLINKSTKYVLIGRS